MLYFQAKAESQRIYEQSLANAQALQQLGKTTYGNTAEKLGSMGLAGSGYAEYLSSQNANQMNSNYATASGQLDNMNNQINTKYSDYMSNLNKEVAQMKYAENMNNGGVDLGGNTGGSEQQNAIYDDLTIKMQHSQNYGGDEAVAEYIFNYVPEAIKRGTLTKKQAEDLYNQNYLLQIDSIGSTEDYNSVKASIEKNKATLAGSFDGLMSELDLYKKGIIKGVKDSDITDVEQYYMNKDNVDKVNPTKRFELKYKGNSYTLMGIKDVDEKTANEISSISDGARFVVYKDKLYIKHGTKYMTSNINGSSKDFIEAITNNN